MVVQRDSISKARTLLVNSTLSERPLEPVTVTILEDGVYQVTIFAIREGIGIVGADVEYSTQITMNQEQGGLIQLHIILLLFLTLYNTNNCISGKQNMNEAIIGKLIMAMADLGEGLANGVRTGNPPQLWK